MICRLSLLWGILYILLRSQMSMPFFGPKSFDPLPIPTEASLEMQCIMKYPSYPPRSGPQW